MTCVTGGGLLLQWPIGWLSDRFDRRRVLLAAALAGIAVAVLARFKGDDQAALDAIGLLLGGAAFAIYPLAIAHANDMIDPAQVVAVSGGLLMSWAAGSVVGPAAATAAMDLLGPFGLFDYLAAVSLLLGGFALWRMARRAAPPAAEQGRFVPMPQTSPASAELNPRAAE